MIQFPNINGQPGKNILAIVLTNFQVFLSGAAHFCDPCAPSITRVDLTFRQIVSTLPAVNNYSLSYHHMYAFTMRCGGEIPV